MIKEPRVSEMTYPRKPTLDATNVPKSHSIGVGGKVYVGLMFKSLVKVSVSSDIQTLSLFWLKQIQNFTSVFLLNLTRLN